MPAPEQRFKPEEEKSIKPLQTRLDALYQKFGIDPNEKANLDSVHFLMNATKPNTKEWAQTKLGVLKDMVQEASLGDENYAAADEALTYWEHLNISA